MALSKRGQVEERYNKPLRDVLINLYAQHGNQADVAKELGVSQGTISLWLVRYGLEVRQVVVDAQPDEAVAS